MTDHPFRDALETRAQQDFAEHDEHREAGRLPTSEQYQCMKSLGGSAHGRCQLAEGHAGGCWWSPFFAGRGRIRYITEPTDGVDD